MIKLAAAKQRLPLRGPEHGTACANRYIAHHVAVTVADHKLRMVMIFWDTFSIHFAPLWPPQALAARRPSLGAQRRATCSKNTCSTSHTVPTNPINIPTGRGAVADVAGPAISSAASERPWRAPPLLFPRLSLSLLPTTQLVSLAPGCIVSHHDLDRPSCPQPPSPSNGLSTIWPTSASSSHAPESR